MKLRNQLLAFFCLVLFVAFGAWYVQSWVLQKPFGIILFVSDGLVTQHIAAARLYKGGNDRRLVLERSMPHMALLSNPANDLAVADDAAAATAMACGTVVNQRNVGVDASGKTLRNILELAKSQGRSVGLVTSGKLTDPTAASFYAHVADARDTDQIAQQLVEKTQLDVVLAGGAEEFQPANAGGRRKDNRNLLEEFRGKKRDLLKTKADLENAGAYRPGGVLGVFAPGALAFSDQVDSGSQQPSLDDMVRRAIEFLQSNRSGYVLVVDASLVSLAAQTNQGERVLNETLRLDQAIATAIKYAGNKSLILAAGKHATGGMSLNGAPPKQLNGLALLSFSGTNHPAISWATGPNGPASKTEPSAFQSPQALTTAQDVVAVGKGKGSEKLRGFVPQTLIFEILREAL